jgi:hypothetical protein
MRTENLEEEIKGKMENRIYKKRGNGAPRLILTSAASPRI